MGGKDRAVLIADLRADRVAIATDLLLDGGDGVKESLDFNVDGVARNEPPRDAEALVVDDQGLADGDAW